MLLAVGLADRRCQDVAADADAFSSSDAGCCAVAKQRLAGDVDDWQVGGRVAGARRAAESPNR